MFEANMTELVQPTRHDEVVHGFDEKLHDITSRDTL